MGHLEHIPPPLCEELCIFKLIARSKSSDCCIKDKLVGLSLVYMREVVVKLCTFAVTLRYS